MLKHKALILFFVVNISMLVLWFRYKDEKELRTFAESDYRQLMNVQFEFKHLPVMHTNNTSYKFLVAVHTAPDHFDRRKLIRETWARDRKIPVVFFVGITEDAETKKKLRQEVEEHGDVVQGTFLDTMHNLTYKHLMIFKFVVYHFPNVEYVVKVNDYAFLNTPNLVDFMDQYSVKHKDSRNILCQTRSGAPVARKGKYSLSEDEYPSDVFPTHCAGYFVIYPRSAVTLLYLAAQKIEYFWMDDILMTGILPKALRIQHINIDKLILDQETKKKIVSNDKFKENIAPFLFIAEKVSVDDAKALWKFVSRSAPKSKILQYLQIYP